MGAAEVIAFEEVRARKQWDTLRQQLHERFDQWLDTLPEVTATVWNLRQQLMGGHDVKTSCVNSTKLNKNA